jgi:hypothetical protein
MQEVFGNELRKEGISCTNMAHSVCSLGPVFRNVCSVAKANISFAMSVCPSVWNNLAPTGQIFFKFDTWAPFEKKLPEISSFIKM